MAYLARRGFDENIIKKFRLGYAPDNNGLKAWLASKNVSESDMIELGLAVLSEKTASCTIFPRPGDHSDHGQTGPGDRFRRPGNGRWSAEVSELSGYAGF